nr:hypothetical protein [Tanacetum cinerariifolium]
MLEMCLCDVARKVVIGNGYNSGKCCHTVDVGCRMLVGHFLEFLDHVVYSNVDAASLRLKLFKDVVAVADANDSPLLGVNTPRSDEDRLKLIELMVFLLQRNACVEIGINAACLSKFLLSGDVTRLQALVDKKRIVITEEVIREILQLNDAEGVMCLPNEEIFAGLARMGYEKPSTKLTFYKAFFSTQWKFFIHTILHSLSAKRTSWNEFSSEMASAVICLSSGQRFNFSNYIFESLVRNVDSSSKFYMYPRFIQLIIQTNIADLSKHTTRYISLAFANMRRVGKGFSGVETPLFEKEVVTDVVPPTPTSPSPPSPVLDTCSALARRIEGLDHDKAALQLEIVKLKARVKKLEKITKVKSSKLRQLKKVGTSQRVESSDDMENVFNQGRIIAYMDQEKGIELVADQEKDAKFKGRHADKQAKIYNIDLDHSSKVLSMQEEDIEVQEVVEIVTTAKLMTEVVTAAPTQVVAANPEEELSFDTPAETPKEKGKGKGILIEAPKPMKKKDQIEMDAEYARKLQEEINKEHEESYKNIDWNAALNHVQSKEPQNTEGYKMEFFKGLKYDEILSIFQAKFDANMRFLFKTREEMEQEDEEIIKNINETPTQKAAKRRKLHKQAKEMKILRSSWREDLEDLWRIVKARFSTSKPTNFSDDYLLSTLKTMFEKADGQDTIWRNQQSVYGQALVKSWKLLTSYGVHIISLTTTTFILLVEKRYPLSKFTLEQLVNMLLELMLLKRPKKNTMCVSAANEELTAAKHKLMLLV